MEAVGAFYKVNMAVLRVKDEMRQKGKPHLIYFITKSLRTLTHTMVLHVRALIRHDCKFMSHIFHIPALPVTSP